MIKHTLDFIANKYIPLILAITGIIINVWINRGEFNPEILLAGMVSGLASTGTFELVKNIRIKRLSEENKGSLEKETEKKEK